MDGNGNNTTSESQFKWTVMDEIGCFLLGNRPEITDDLYVLSVIIVGARNFEKLIPGRSKSELLTFLITSECFGVAYEGEEFKLEIDPRDPNHLTYCGDRCTARIRCSSKEFKRFLENFTMIMTVNVRSDETDVWNPVGQAHVPFAELLQQPEVNKCYEIFFDGPANPNDTAPTLQVNLDYTKSPKYFETARQYEECNSREVSICTSKQSLTEIGAGDAPGLDQTIDRLSNSFRDRLEIVGVGTTTAQASVKKRTEDLTSNRLIRAPEQLQTNDKTKPASQVNLHARRSVIQSAACESSNVTQESSSTVGVKITSNVVVQGSTAPHKPQEKVTNPVSAKPSSSAVPNVTHRPIAAYADAIKRFIPGNYEVRFFFRNASLKIRSGSKCDRTWKLVLFHDVFGVSEDDKTEIETRSQPDAGGKACCITINKEEIWDLQIPELTHEMLETPIEILIRPSGIISKPIRCVAELPIGEAFVGLTDNRFCKEYTLKIIYAKPNSRLSIGTFNCALEVSRSFDDSGHATLQQPVGDGTPETSFVLETPKTVHKSCVPTETSSPRKSIDITAYEREFKEQLKAKEEAFLKMLSDEYKKQTDDNEAAMKKMHKTIEEKKASYDEKFKELDTRETELRRKEIVLETRQRKTALDAKQMIQEYELKYKKLEAEKNIEIEALKQRLKSALSETEIAKSRIRSVEAKLKEQKEEMEQMKSHNAKDVVAAAQGKTLMQENVQLKRDLKKAREDRDRLKHQMDSEQQKRLQDENDLLRSQMYRRDPAATSQQDRRTFQANPSRALKEANNVTQPSRMNNITVRNSVHDAAEAENQNHSSPRSITSVVDEEIARLSNLKKFLLDSLCYRSDSEVIKDIEAKITEYRLQRNSGIH